MINTPENEPTIVPLAVSKAKLIKTNLLSQGWATPEELRKISWHTTFCRALDEGYPIDSAHIANVINGAEITYLPPDIDSLPRVEGTATDANLGLGSIAVNRPVTPTPLPLYTRNRHWH